MYVSIEGLDGAGKTTAIRAITDILLQQNLDVVCIEDLVSMVREPGGTPLAEALRDLVKKDHEYETVDAKTESLIFFAARNQLLTNVVIPEIKKNKIVISDRCYLSSIAYQTKEKELVRYLSNSLAIKPDLIIYLDIDPIVGLQRSRSRGEIDRIEKNHISFFEEARKIYLEEAANNDFIITVNAEQSIEQVYNDVQAVFLNYLANKK